MSPTPVRIGALRHRLRLERAALADDGSTLWTPVDTVFAAITALDMASVEAGGGEGGRVTHRIEIRWRADVDARDRLRLDDRVFRIRAARDLDERRRRLVILAEEDDR